MHFTQSWNNVSVKVKTNCHIIGRMSVWWSVLRQKVSGGLALHAQPEIEPISILIEKITNNFLKACYDLQKQ